MSIKDLFKDVPCKGEETEGQDQDKLKVGGGYMFCPECGTKNEDTAKFCIKCGKSLNYPSENATTPSDQINDTNQSTAIQTQSKDKRRTMGLIFPIMGGPFGPFYIQTQVDREKMKKVFIITIIIMGGVAVVGGIFLIIFLHWLFHFH